MARLQPRQELIDLKNKFSQKNSISEFKNLHKNLHQEMKKYKSEEKSKGGEYETIISELHTLNCIIDKYKPSHIKYTGIPKKGQATPSFDGKLYFENEEQLVEITGIVDEKDMKSFRICKGYELATLLPITTVMEQLCLTEEKAREYLKNKRMDKQPLVEDFLYKKITCLLKKKNKPNYRDFWLLVSYYPSFYLSDFGQEKVRNYVLKKIKSNERNLVSSIKKIFRKTIFVPFDTGMENHQIFEWDL